MKKYIVLLLLFANIYAKAQHIESHKDSVEIIEIEEVHVTDKKAKELDCHVKIAASIDELLSSGENISFIKRGAYAWEPLLNNMSTERSVITIDGMHIFGACSDKMDPVSTYVESNNLASIDVKSGQAGAMHGATVAGSIDLKKRASTFSSSNIWSGAYQSGIEFNNKQFFNLANVSFTSKKFVADASIGFRKADNYLAGNAIAVRNSQFKKFNSAIGLAYKIDNTSSIRADAIFDVAKDVGYAALPMDLWLSRALISSLAYKKFFEKGSIAFFDTKVYFNAVEHYMDDTKRPENLVHMDMPGWSTTYGLLSKIGIDKNKFSSEIQVNAYSNLSIAEMRMYPQDRSNQTMFAYTWPWVKTNFASLSTSNLWSIGKYSQVVLGGSLALHNNHSKYISFNRIFHPNASQAQTRILPSINTSYVLSINKINFSAGAAYGHRAPSISEGYGYYIYNSFDRYDYIGNPDLKNEISYELNASLGFKNEKISLEGKINYFYIQDYIIGKILNLGSPMNYQSVGVKGYTSLAYATLLNFSVSGKYTLAKGLYWDGIVNYASAKSHTGSNLPFIRPLSYRTSLQYTYKHWSFQSSINGDLAQSNYSPEYGEDKTAAYIVWNAAINYSFHIKKVKSTIQFGVENLLDEYYSTYADWGNIPRMGRNFFSAIKINF